MERKPFSSKAIKVPKTFRPNEIRGEERVIKTFTCQICLNLVNDPLFCNNCASASCRECLTEYFNKRNQNQDIQCINRCGGTSYRKMTLKEKEFIDFIKLKCRHNGCMEFINYSDYKEHLEKCKFRIYHCDNPHCRKEGYLSQLEEHAKKCKYRPIECEKCKKKIISKDKEEHLNQDCPETIVKCIFCNLKMKRSEYLNKHQSKDALCLKNILEACKKKLAENEEEIKTKNIKINSLKNSIKDCEKKIKEKDIEIQSLIRSKGIIQKKNENKNKEIEEFKTFIIDAYNRFIEKNNPEEQNLNINNEIQKKESQNQNIFLKTEMNFHIKKDIIGRNRINNYINNYGSLTERKIPKTMRRINSEAIFNNDKKSFKSEK